MQPDLRDGISTITPKNAYEGVEISQKLQDRKTHGAQRLQRLSPTGWHFILIVGDDVLLITLLALVLLLTPHLDLELRASSYEISSWYLKILWGVLALISWSVAARITQAQVLRHASNRLQSPLYVVFALMLMLIFWVGLTYPIITSGLTYSRAVLFFLILAAPVLSVWRVAFAVVINLPRFQRRAVIVGVNPAREAIVRELCSAKWNSITILGYIHQNADESRQTNGLPVLGGNGTLRRLTQSDMIDMVIMAIDGKESPELFQEAMEATHLGLPVVPLTVVYESMSGKIPVEQIDDQWYMALPAEGIIPLLYLCWRKVVDIIFGLLGLVALILILPVLALLIYFDSPGPIFYSQERLGQYGRKFRMYKFRSMHTHAEQAGRAVWASEGDARVTRIGQFLRATHLDELPQVLNILRGEMSLIGPRPERGEHVSELEKSSLFYRCRMTARPGLTGWAQVGYGYGTAYQDELVKLQYDLYYIKHQSFMLDIVIILKTIVEVVRAHGK